MIQPVSGVLAMALASVEEWRVRFGLSWCALGRPFKTDEPHQEEAFIRLRFDHLAPSITPLHIAGQHQRSDRPCIKRRLAQYQRSLMTFETFAKTPK